MLRAVIVAAVLGVIPRVARAEMPAVRYAAMSQDDCEAELTTRGIGFTRETAKGEIGRASCRERVCYAV